MPSGFANPRHRQNCRRCVCVFVCCCYCMQTSSAQALRSPDHRQSPPCLPTRCKAAGTGRGREGACPFSAIVGDMACIRQQPRKLHPAHDTGILASCTTPRSCKARSRDCIARLRYVSFGNCRGGARAFESQLLTLLILLLQHVA